MAHFVLFCLIHNDVDRRGACLILSLKVVPTFGKAKFDGDKMNMLKARTKYNVQKQ